MSQVKQMSAQEEKRLLLEKIKELNSKIPSVHNKELKVTAKISEKGAISFYGLRRQFPPTLYFSELMKIVKLAATPDFQKFVQDNADQLAKKEKEANQE